MDNRINSSEENIKREMIEANQDMEKTLKNKILKVGEPDELIRFRESWLLRIQDIKFLRRQKRHTQNSLLSIIIPLLLSFKFALIEFFYIDEIAYWNGYYIYPSHIGWVFLSISFITIIKAFKNQNNCINIASHKKLNSVYIFRENADRVLGNTQENEFQLQAPLPDKK
jgi:hypothetical protein